VPSLRSREDPPESTGVIVLPFPVFASIPVQGLGAVEEEVGWTEDDAVLPDGVLPVLDVGLLLLEGGLYKKRPAISSPCCTDCNQPKRTENSGVGITLPWTFVFHRRQSSTDAAPNPTSENNTQQHDNRPEYAHTQAQNRPRPGIFVDRVTLLRLLLCG
jgi:hypothetical protein